jgi:hypothetical protein
MSTIAEQTSDAIAIKLADLLALLKDEHPAQVYTAEGYAVWLRGVTSQLIVAGGWPELIEVAEVAQKMGRTHGSRCHCDEQIRHALEGVTSMRIP